MKSKLDKLYFDKLATVPFDFKKLSDAVDKKVVKKDQFDELVTKVNVIDTSKLVNKTDYNSKIKDTEGKIPSITNLATTAALTAVEYKIPNVSNLVKKNQIMLKNKK